ncbi:MAG: hypothetical protein HRU38_18290, partial [Saccharospirillaceae bacterium]|nr:hypothetical protein [Pseudomonadales bacterium]NRB80587.1 hypothetical protein [Saccharospirillaceae bacterium]
MQLARGQNNTAAQVHIAGQGLKIQLQDLNELENNIHQSVNMAAHNIRFNNIQLDVSLTADLDILLSFMSSFAYQILDYANQDQHAIGYSLNYQWNLFDNSNDLTKEQGLFTLTVDSWFDESSHLQAFIDQMNHPMTSIEWYQTNFFSGGNPLFADMKTPENSTSNINCSYDFLSTVQNNCARNNAAPSAHNLTISGDLTLNSLLSFDYDFLSNTVYSSQLITTQFDLDSTILEVADASDFIIGDYARIQSDTSLNTQFGSEVVKITEING